MNHLVILVIVFLGTLFLYGTLVNEEEKEKERSAGLREEYPGFMPMAAPVNCHPGFMPMAAPVNCHPGFMPMAYTTIGPSHST